MTKIWLPSRDNEIYKKRLTERVGIDEKGCWIWLKGKYSVGYGQFCMYGKNVGAHIASYTLFKGDIPKGLCVLHRCDVRACINPDHLFLGTKRENTLDMVSKGRCSRKGGSKYKVTEEIYSKVISLHNEGFSHENIAKVVGIGKSRVGYLIQYGYDYKFHRKTFQ